MSVKFHTIATHKNIHFDEIVGIWLLIQFGKSRYPGIEDAEIVYWDKLPEGTSAIQLEREGFKLVGIGGGAHDEHPSERGGRKKGECSATLIAHDLDIRNKPALRKILDFATSRDLKLGESEFELPAVVKALHDTGRSSDVIYWTFLALSAIYEKQRRFFEEAPGDFAAAKIIDVTVHNGRSVKMVVGRSDADTFCAYARSSRGCNAGIVVQMNSRGNVVIQTNQILRLDLTDTIRMLRVEELRLAGKPVPRDWKLLGGEQNVEPCWYMHPRRGMILNGSTTCSAPPTKLSLQTIEAIVRIGVNPAVFHPDRMKQCKKMICSSTPGNPCPWYVYGLDRCHSLRIAAANREVPASRSIPHSSLTAS